MTVIAFVGSVFSPYYASARRRGAAEPEDFCAVNVALYGAGGHRWAMTERGRRWMSRGPDLFRVGPSGLRWDGRALEVSIDEMSVPIPRRLKGRIRLEPVVSPGVDFAIDGAGRHRWRPIAPRARVSLAFDKPGLSWEGDGYLDSNHGSEPLEAGFRSWHWSRAADGDGAIVLYDTVRRDGSRGRLALRFAADGAVSPFEPPPECRLPTTLWRIGRATRGPGARVVETLEDTPFYARSLVATTIEGRALTTFHESLDCDRFAARWVQTLLPFRMPRRG